MSRPVRETALSGELFTAMRAAAINHPPASNSGHPGAEAMAAGADKPARLISAFHGKFSVRILYRAVPGCGCIETLARKVNNKHW